MSSKIRRIDPNLNLGLHELAKPAQGRGSFHFQLRYAEEQSKDILSNLDSLVENTIAKAPVRAPSRGFRLKRTTAPRLIHEEAKWERAMYEKWGPRGSGVYLPVCQRLQDYQFPLQNSRSDKGWGKIDLLGIGVNFLPVPNELKKRQTNESPLRMLVEVAAYGFALRKVWPELKDDWIKKVSWLEGSPSNFRANLERVTLVGVAPKEYWKRCLGQLRETKAGKFPDEAWPPFWDLVDALGKWFDIHFVEVEGSLDDKEMPLITGARILDLRSESRQ